MNTPNREIQWYVARNRKRYGPVEDNELRQLVSEGYVRANDKLWCQGMENWVDASTIPGLFDLSPNEPYALNAHSDQPQVPETQQAPAPQRSPQPQSPGPHSRPPHKSSEQAPHPTRQQVYQNEIYADSTADFHDHGRRNTPLVTGEYPNEPQFAGYSDKSDHSGARSSGFSAPADMFREPAKRGSWFKRSIYGLVFLGVLIAIGNVGLSYFVNPETIRDQIVSAVEEQTGRKFEVRGKTSFSFFPNIGVKLNNVTLANPAGMAGEPLLRMASLTISLKFIPLLSRNVEIEEFVLANPTVSLQVNRNGKNNWVFEKSSGSRQSAISRPSTQLTANLSADSTKNLLHKTVWEPVKTANQNRNIRLAQATSNPAGSASMLKGLKLGEVKITDGILTYHDEKTNSRQELSKINISLSLPDFSAPLEADGKLELRNKEVDIQARIESIAKLLNDQSSPAKVSLSSKDLKYEFEGQIISLSSFTLQGKTNAKSNSLRNLAGWMGTALPQSPGYGPLSFSAIVKATSKEILLSQVKLNLDQLQGQGNANIILSGKRPLVRATLNANQLDLNDYLEGASGNTSNKKAQISPSAGNPGPQKNEKNTLTNMIEQINEDKAPVIVDEVTTTAATGRLQSTSESNSDAMKVADADIKLVVAKLNYKAMKAGRSDLAVKLTDGILVTDLKDMSFYGGRITGTVKFEKDAAVPKFSTALNMTGISSLPFLKDAMDFDWISGIANLALNISGSGLTETEISKSLAGNGKIEFTDGAIEGVNIPQMIRNAQGGNFKGFSREQSQKTDFSQLSGTFTMQEGVAKNSDLQLIGPLLRSSGAGQVSIPREYIDYKLQPKLVASLEGQGGARDLSGISIPVRIKGPWKKPEIIPDLNAILNNPQAVIDGVGQIGQALKGKKGKKDFESVINGVLGTSKTTDENGQTKTIGADEILKNLLGN